MTGQSHAPATLPPDKGPLPLNSRLKQTTVCLNGEDQSSNAAYGNNPYTVWEPYEAIR